ncbi:MAG: DNRLRE domain-containing protein [Candidatus Eisenbacteria bacterium]|jgi:hypothetical protein|nr:DNRLRE domain-containing protein [Candidatus Eisenbacteria bacterium]
MAGRPACLAAASVALALACGTKEGPVAPWLGDRPGQGSGSLVLTVDSADAETTFSHVVPLGGASVLFVGRDGGYEGRSLVRFGLPDTTVQSYGASKLVLTLQASQDAVPVRFRLYRVSQFWNETLVTWERANTDSLGDLAWDVPGGVFSPIAIAEAGPCSLQADTVRIEFSLPPEVTAGIYADHAANYGFMVGLEDEGLTQLLWRFHSRETAVNLRPRWEVSFVDTAGNDTTRVLYAAADASLMRRVAPPDQGRLLVGSGVGYRSLLRFLLPEVLDSTVTINSATLYVYCDTTQAFLETKSLQVNLIDSIWRGDSTAVRPSYVSQALVIPGTSEVAFSFAPAVRAWTTGAADNHGVMIRFGTEDNAVAYCPLFPRSGPAGLVPRLEIHYSLPPTPPGGYAPLQPRPPTTAPQEERA